VTDKAKRLETLKFWEKRAQAEFRGGKHLKAVE
jgi:hypothetical protein